MGRSGTSAIAGALAAAGFHAGRDGDLMPGNAANPAGYYENALTYDVNEAILRELGASWFDPPSPEAQSGARPGAEPQIRELLDRLQAERCGAPVVVKDPRVGVLLEVWGPLVRERLHPVLAVRHPVEIARSLAVRDGTPIPFALASWESHMTRVLAFLDGRPVTVARYPQLIGLEAELRGVVEDVAAHLTPELAERVTVDGVERTLRPDLHRNAATAAAADEHLTVRQIELWRYLGGLGAGRETLAVPDELRRSGAGAPALVRAETERVAGVARAADLHRHVTALQGAWEEQHARAEAAEQRLAETYAWGEAAEQRVSEAGGRAEIAERRLSDIERSRAWRATAPLRSSAGRWRRLRAAALSIWSTAR